MRSLRFFFLLTSLSALFFSCNKELNVNADWQDITVVYSLLDRQDTLHYFKITKAFLGPGDALQFAKIADSSNYADSLDVTLEAWDGTVLKNTYIAFDTIIENKEAGDSIFYYPYQRMYCTRAILNQDYTYKLFIRNKKTGKEITSVTQLVHDFSIEKPMGFMVGYIPGKNSEVKWMTAKAGKRYQLTIRFHYAESPKSDPSKIEMKFIDWIVFNDQRSFTTEGGAQMDFYFPGDAFYMVLRTKILVNPDVNRAARHVDYIFSVAGEDLNTYMEVTEPSLTIVQERPSFTNIVNGIGLFSTRFEKVKDSLLLNQNTLTELKVNPFTSDLGF